MPRVAKNISYCVSRLHRRARPLATNMETLTPSQLRAAHFVLNGSGNCLIDGPPGNGKSYLLKVLQEELSKRRVKHFTLAPRGACAFIVVGDTIHSKLLPLHRNRPYFEQPSDLHDALRSALAGHLGQPQSRRGKARSEFWRGLDILFIDEVGAPPPSTPAPAAGLVVRNAILCVRPK